MPSSQTISQYGTASVDIIATLGVREIVAAYDLDIAYDPSIVTATAVSFGSMLGGPANSLPGAIGTSGLIDLWEVSFLSDADLALLQGAGPITLATLFFRGDNIGTSPLSFINYGQAGNDIKGYNNIPYGSPTLDGGSITVSGTAVPLPPSILLLGFGLMGLAGIRRKQS
ncbi:MAG: PEP-CTERM sorting domain-containing protein [Smithella sp.]